MRSCTRRPGPDHIPVAPLVPHDGHLTSPAVLLRLSGSSYILRQGQAGGVSSRLDILQKRDISILWPARSNRQKGLKEIARDHPLVSKPQREATEKALNCHFSPAFCSAMQLAAGLRRNSFDDLTNSGHTIWAQTSSTSLCWSVFPNPHVCAPVSATPSYLKHIPPPGSCFPSVLSSTCSFF